MDELSPPSVSHNPYLPEPKKKKKKQGSGEVGRARIKKDTLVFEMRHDNGSSDHRCYERGVPHSDLCHTPERNFTTAIMMA